MRRALDWAAVAIVAMLYVGALLALWPEPDYLKPPSEAQSAQDKQSDTKRPPATIEPKDQPPSAEDEKDCANSQNRSDCLIQLRAARATEAQARYAKWGLWLIGGTIVLTFGTVVAGFLTLTTMRDTARKQLRAYVFVEPSTIEFEGTTPKALHFETRNTGETPAYRIIAFNAFRLLPYPLPNGFAHPPPDDGGDTTNILAPKSTRPSTRKLGKQITPATEAKLRAGTHRYYTFVTVRYRDAFYNWLFRREVRTTRMCASIPGDQMIAGMYAAKGEVVEIKWEYDPSHNDAD
jgi:hypothetical protein